MKRKNKQSRRSQLRQDVTRDDLAQQWIEQVDDRTLLLLSAFPSDQLQDVLENEIANRDLEEATEQLELEVAELAKGIF